MEAHSDEYIFIRRLILFCILIGGCIAVLSLLTNGPAEDPQKNKSSDKVDLHADVAFRDRFLSVRNGDNFDWENVDIEVTSTFVPEFKISLGSLRAGSTVSLSYSDFTGKNGAQLDPAKLKSRKVTIWSTTSKGKGLWYGEL